MWETLRRIVRQQSQSRINTWSLKPFLQRNVWLRLVLNGSFLFLYLTALSFLYRIEKWNDPFSRVFCSYFLFISLLPFPVFFSHNSPPLCPVALGNNHKYIMEMAMSLVSDQTFVFPSVSDSRRLGSLRWIHERVQRGVPCISSLLYSLSRLGHFGLFGFCISPSPLNYRLGLLGR